MKKAEMCNATAQTIFYVRQHSYHFTSSPRLVCLYPQLAPPVINFTFLFLVGFF